MSLLRRICRGVTTLSDDMIEISDANFETLVKGSERLIIDCWAPWCGPCRMLAPTFEALAKDYKGRVTFAKLDTDQSPKTAMSLGILSIPTLIFFKKGEQVERMTGAHPRANIENTLKKNLL